MSKDKKQNSKSIKLLLATVVVSILITLTCTFVVFKKLNMLQSDLLFFYIETVGLTDHQKHRVEKLKKENIELKEIVRSHSILSGGGWRVKEPRETKKTTLEKEEKENKISYGGIGAAFKKGPNGFIIVRVYPKSPAMKAGLHIGDEVTEIDGVITGTMTPLEFNAKVRGTVGTMVKLTYRPSGSLKKTTEVDIQRELIEIEKDK